MGIFYAHHPSIVHNAITQPTTPNFSIVEIPRNLTKLNDVKTFMINLRWLR